MHSKLNSRDEDRDLSDATFPAFMLQYWTDELSADFREMLD